MMVRFGPTGQTAQGWARIKSGHMMLRNKLFGLRAQARVRPRMGSPMGKALSPTSYGTLKRDRAASTVTVRRSALDPRRGWLVLDGNAIPVALGRGGIKANKFEGDGGT